MHVNKQQYNFQLCLKHRIIFNTVWFPAMRGNRATTVLYCLEWLQAVIYSFGKNLTVCRSLPAHYLVVLPWVWHADLICNFLITKPDKVVRNVDRYGIVKTEFCDLFAIHTSRKKTRLQSRRCWVKLCIVCTQKQTNVSCKMLLCVICFIRIARIFCKFLQNCI